VVIPGAFAALLSGLVLSLVTPWGLIRYWWVLSKPGRSSSGRPAGSVARGQGRVAQLVGS
jgi:hypothetical protein